ncbi:hypothetical protein [Pseudomonas sp. DR 5-09]|uniref:hypothetical protein n=1 Tax=Pseudomonas sp. DR 5-09 TaxID=1534110 RepID=UPI0007E4B83C|nr:hypothetical protein [Pseudomonas sp. DR 5-09]
MTPEAKTDANQRGFDVLFVNGPNDQQWVDVFIHGTQQGFRFGTIEEGWNKVQELINRDSYGIGN